MEEADRSFRPMQQREEAETYYCDRRRWGKKHRWSTQRAQEELWASWALKQAHHDQEAAATSPATAKE